MSQTPSDADAVADFQASIVANSLGFSMAALTAYEYIITFDQEIAAMWKRKWSLATWTFMANRYIMIIIAIWIVSPSTAQVSFADCSPGMIFGEMVLVAQNCVFAIFSTFRVFAMCDRNIPMSLLVLALNLVPIATNIDAYVQQATVFTMDPGPECETVLNVPANVEFEFVLGTRLAIIIADVLVLILTWRKTFTTQRDASRVGIRTPLSKLLLRDGTIYFVVLLAMNIAQILVNTVSSLQSLSPVTTIIEALQPILVSRFLLNLRQITETEHEREDAYNSSFSIPRFRVPTLASILGNLGEDLVHSFAEDDNDTPYDLSQERAEDGVSTLDSVVACETPTGGLPGHPSV